MIEVKEINIGLKRAYLITKIDEQSLKKYKADNSESFSIKHNMDNYNETSKKIANNYICGNLQDQSKSDYLFHSMYSTNDINIPELAGISYEAPYAGVIGALSVLKLKNPHLNIGVSVGGWGESGQFHGVAKDKVKRQNFANNIVKFIEYLGFDFVDIDWEHPTVSREGCPGGPEDTENFTLLMKELRNALDKLGEKNGRHYE